MCVDRVHVFLFFFKQKTAYEMRISDWSSDVCSSDLIDGGTITADGDIALTAGGAIAIAQATMQGDGLLSLAGTDGISVDTLVSQGRTSLASSDGAITIANLASQGAINAARSEEHTYELQSLIRISYAVFCLNKKNNVHH